VHSKNVFGGMIYSVYEVTSYCHTVVKLP